jgi:hypothetical protein
MSTQVFAQNNPFVPSDFKAPAVLENQHFRVRMLTVNDLIKDYDAVMTSIDHLKGVFGPSSNWPSKELSLEQDLIDLGWHQKEFQRGSSFTYTVVSLDESKVLGCVYIYPTSKSNYNAQIILWVRESVFEDGMDKILYSSIKEWIGDAWPFSRAAYPGRDISWEDWNSLI